METVISEPNDRSRPRRWDAMTDPVVPLADLPRFYYLAFKVCYLSRKARALRRTLSKVSAQVDDLSFQLDDFLAEHSVGGDPCKKSP